MYTFKIDAAAPKSELYAELARAADALTSGEPDAVANMANVAALLWEYLPDVNWAGFYRVVDGELVLGPFQGKAACIRIPFGKGVCGTAAQTGETQLVEDVHAFPGHIACDANSASELVVAVKRAGKVIAVIDLDSPSLNRFNAQDAKGVELLAGIIAARIYSLTSNLAQAAVCKLRGLRLSVRIKIFPSIGTTALQWPVARLILHPRCAVHPITQIDIWKPCGPCAHDMVHDDEVTKASAAFDIRIIKTVNHRHAIALLIGQASADQFAKSTEPCRCAIFDHMAANGRMFNHVSIVHVVHIRHTAIGMARRKIMAQQVILLGS
jgi:GAF domain-containing protein